MKPLCCEQAAWSWLVPVFLLFSGVLSAQTTLWITMEAGKADRPRGPVFMAAPAAMKKFDYFLIVDGGTNKKQWGQRWGSDSIVFILNRPLAAGQKRTYVLEGVKQRPTSGVQLIQAEGRIHVRQGGRDVLTYQMATAMPPAGSPEYFRRSGFIHPLKSPSGQTLTDDFPVGHTHQHGVFMAWVNTTFHGEKADFWNQQEETATVGHMSVLDTLSGPVFARFSTRLRHVSVKYGPALEENWTVTVWNLDDPFMVDIRSEQWCASADTLFLNNYHYGGMAFRGRAEWNATDSTRFRGEMKVLTREGLDRAASNHTRPGWISAWGPAGEGQAGIAILDHPGNFRFPQHVRVHPEMPYLCFPPMVESGFMIVPGDRYLSNYRMILFDGAASAPLIDPYWQDYTRK